MRERKLIKFYCASVVIILLFEFSLHCMTLLFFWPLLQQPNILWACFTERQVLLMTAFVEAGLLIWLACPNSDSGKLATILWFSSICITGCIGEQFATFGKDCELLRELLFPRNIIETEALKTGILVYMLLSLPIALIEKIGDATFSQSGLNLICHMLHKRRQRF